MNSAQNGESVFFIAVTRLILRSADCRCKKSLAFASVWLHSTSPNVQPGQNTRSHCYISDGTHWNATAPLRCRSRSNKLPQARHRRRTALLAGKHGLVSSLRDGGNLGGDRSDIE